MGRRPVLLAISILMLAAVGAPLGATQGAVAAAGVPNPTVYGPIHGGIRGYMWNHSLFPLDTPAYHYSEHEYFFSGTATDLSTGAQAPYESRMFVRLPTVEQEELLAAIEQLLDGANVDFNGKHKLPSDK